MGRAAHADELGSTTIYELLNLLHPGADRAFVRCSEPSGERGPVNITSNTALIPARRRRFGVDVSIGSLV